MADWFVDDAAADNTGTGAWNDPLKYLIKTDGSANPGLFDLGTPPAAGDRVFVLTGHSEDTSGVNDILTSNGTPTAPIQIISVADFNSGSPNTLGAANSCTFGPSSSNTLTLNGATLFYGFITQCGNVLKTSRTKMHAGQIKLLGTGSRVEYGSVSDEHTLELINCTVDSVATSQVFRPYYTGRLVWRGGAVNAMASGCNLFGSFYRGGNAEIEGVDLSLVDTLVNVPATVDGLAVVRGVGCKLKSGVTVANDPLPPGSLVEFSNCDTSAGNKRFYCANQSGYCTEETSIVRSGGADTGETSGTHAIKMAPNTGVSETFPLVSPIIGPKWANFSSSKTVDVYIGNNTRDLTDQDIRIDLFYPKYNSGGHARVDTNGANWLVDSTNHADDTSSSWGGGGLTYMQKISITAGGATDGREGPCYARVYLAADIDVYVDAELNIS